MKAKNIIWGLVLVLIGVLFILKNLDIIYFSWHSLWRLWPMILVLIGIAILPVKEVIKIILAIIVMIAGALFLVYAPDPRGDDWTIHIGKDKGTTEELKEVDQRIFEAYDTTMKEAVLNFDAAAGDFRIDQTTTELFEFEREGKLGKYNYSIMDLGSKREINIGLEEGHFRSGDFKNKASVKLNPALLWELKVDVGAASIDMDLSSFKINKLNIDGGASSINVRLGNLQDESHIKINSGASSISIKVPQEYGCQVSTSTILSSKDLPGFNKSDGGKYITPGFSDSSRNIYIDVEAAVSSLNVERY